MRAAETDAKGPRIWAERESKKERQAQFINRMGMYENYNQSAWGRPSRSILDLPAVSGQNASNNSIETKFRLIAPPRKGRHERGSYFDGDARGGIELIGAAMFAPKIAKPQTNAAESPIRKQLQRGPFAARPFGWGAVEQVFRLQRTIGNQATLGLLAQQTSILTKQTGGDHEQTADPASLTARGVTPRPSWGFSKIPVFAPDRVTGPQARPSRDAWPLPAVIQPKLIVQQVDDPLEHEADRLADQVMRMPSRELSKSRAPEQLSRKCTACEEEDHQLRTKSAGMPVAASGEVPGVVHEVLHSPGQSIDAHNREFFESRFGRNFGDVRIHTDSRANESAQAVNALAYTLGNHVVFANGQYAPASGRGRRLLAHELVHVLQQTTGGRSVIQRSIIECAEELAPPPDLALIKGGGIAVHNLIRAHFKSKTGASDVVIPGASAAPLRTEGLCGKPSSIIPPQPLGGRAGAGIPDLAMQTARGILLVAEIKPAVIECLIDGENQVLGYINAGVATDPQQVSWKAGLGVSVVSPMLESHYTPPSFSVGVADVKTAWCNPGLLAYTVHRRGQLPPIPIPVRERKPVTVEQKKALRERLPTVPEWAWAAIGVTAAALIIACFATGVCEAGAIVAAVGEGIGSIIVAAMRLAGIGLLARAAEAPAARDRGGSSAIA
jgi:hypothetical protein